MVNTPDERRKTLLIISFSPISRDPRVKRQILALQNRYHIVVAGFPPGPEDDTEWIDLPRISRSLLNKATTAWALLSGAFEHCYWHTPHIRQARRLLETAQFDAILANDIDALPLALKLASGRPVVFDAHEYSPLEFEDRLLWRLLLKPYRSYLCRRYMPLASSCTTVCSGIAERYAEAFGVKPAVVTNACQLQPITPRKTGSRIRLIHHGIAIPSRQLEITIRAMAHVNEHFTLDLMLVDSDTRYFRRLLKLIEDADNINIVAPVPMESICSTISEYDVGVFQLPPSSFNSSMALPNKLFEFIQARLAVVIGPSPEMARLVKKYSLGVVAENFSAPSLAAAINSLTPEVVDKFKENSDIAAYDLSFENQAHSIRDSVEQALAKRTPEHPPSSASAPPH